jgi:hypothetical protein
LECARGGGKIAVVVDCFGQTNMTHNLICVTLLIGYTSPVSSESDGFLS